MSAVAHSSTLPELDLSGEQPQLSQQAISTYSDSVDQLTWQLHSEYAGPKESVLPREFRQRLHKHFARIEQEFEREYRRLCGENLALQERLEKFEDGDHSESTTLAKKLGASMLSQRIKQQYKQSTSRLVSSLRQSTGHSTGGAAIPSSPMTHGPTHGVPFAQSNSSVQVATSLPSATAGPAVFVGSFAGHGGMWQLMSRVSAHRDGIWEVTPYRRFVASASADTTVRLWSNDVQLNCLLVYMGHCGSVNSVRFRGRDQLMLTSSGDGTAHLIKMPYDLLLKAAGSRASHGPTGVTSPVNQEGTTTATSADVAGSAFSMPMCPTPGTAVKFPLDSDEAVCDSADDGGSSNAPVHVQHPHAVFQSANIYPVGSSCVLTGAANSSGTAATNNSMDSSPLSAADFLTCGDQIVTAGWDRLGRIYDLTTGQEVNSLTGHGHQLTDVRCSPAGVPIVVTSSRDCTFRLWDFRQPGMRVHVQQAHTQALSTTQFICGGPTERLISAGGDRFCRIWDLRQTRGPLVSIRTDSGINRLAISGSSITSGLLSGDCAVDSPLITLVSSMPASSATEVTSSPSATLQSSNMTATPPRAAPTSNPVSVTAAIAGVSSSVAGQTWATSLTHVLALPLDNRGIKFFDLTGSRIGRLTRSSSRGHTRMVTSVAWSDEGVCNFFSAGFDSRLLAWQLHLNN